MTVPIGDGMKTACYVGDIKVVEGLSGIARRMLSIKDTRRPNKVWVYYVRKVPKYIKVVR